MREMGQIMNYLKVVIPLVFLVVNVAQAAQLNTPQMLAPTDGANLPLQKLAKFSWQKVTGATKYRVIFSNDKSFANYDVNKFKCLNTKTCFIFTVASPSYNVAATHAMLKTDGNYFWQVQSVGKTAADNSKMGIIRSFSVGTPVPPTIQSILVNPTQVTLGTAATIKATLDRALAIGLYNIQISIDGGEPQAMTGSSTDFSFSYTPTEIGEPQFQVDILDAKGEVVDSNGDGFTVIAATIPVTSPTKTTSYTKIANNGSVLSDSAKLGAAPTDWACTKDNTTGLIWEVKTTDGGSHDSSRTYSWNYSSQYPIPVLVTVTNIKSLCGAEDWRMPTYGELYSIFVKSDSPPSIDKIYFPNTLSKDYWSSTLSDDSKYDAWVVGFGSNYIQTRFTLGYDTYPVRLVH